MLQLRGAYLLLLADALLRLDVTASVAGNEEDRGGVCG